MTLAYIHGLRLRVCVCGVTVDGMEKIFFIAFQHFSQFPRFTVYNFVLAPSWEKKDKRFSEFLLHSSSLTLPIVIVSFGRILSRIHGRYAWYVMWCDVFSLTSFSVMFYIFFVCSPFIFSLRSLSAFYTFICRMPLYAHWLQLAIFIAIFIFGTKRQ